MCRANWSVEGAAGALTEAAGYGAAMPTWKLQDRRGFATIGRLGELAGTGIILAGTGQMPEGLTDAQRAMAIAEAGEFCLSLAIETAASGKPRSVYKAMTPDSGATAAVFFAHGIAASLARLASAPGHHLSSARQEEARALLRTHLPWSADDEGEVERIVSDIEPESPSHLDHARLGVAFGAVSRIVGDDAARRLPGFAAWFGDDEPVEQLVLGLGWQVCWNHMLDRYLAITDPAGLRASRS